MFTFLNWFLFRLDDVFQAIAAKQLMNEGIEISGGQMVWYLITDAENRRAGKRVKAAELVNAETRFDVEKYVDMLIVAGANILSPFGYTKDALKDQIVVIYIKIPFLLLLSFWIFGSKTKGI